MVVWRESNSKRNNSEQWKRRFAWFPTIVERQEDGTVVKAWLQSIEMRGGWSWSWHEARLPGSDVSAVTKLELEQ
jgi:hypothetical protein